MDAGELKERVTVLRLVENPEGFAWEAVRRTWAQVEEGKGKSLFSTLGLGAQGLKLVLRRQGLTLHDAILWRGRHCLLTKIRDKGRLYLEAEAALVDPVTCRADPDRRPEGRRFPAVLTEKYLRHEQEEPMAVNTICYVLVTPKPVELVSGRLVDVAGTAYQILNAHVLDPYQNEYEILRKRDL